MPTAHSNPAPVEAPILELVSTHEVPSGKQNRYRLLDLRSPRLVQHEPLSLESLEGSEMAIFYVQGVSLCAFGETVATALGDLRSTIEERFDELSRLGASAASNPPDRDLHDWLVLRRAFRRVTEDAAQP